MTIIRDATLTDLPAIVDIYNQSIPGGRATADTQPITVADRLPWFAQFDTEKRPLWVAEQHGQIVGCVYLASFYGGRPAYDKTAEISLYISTAAQGTGLGTLLMQEMIDACPRLGVTTLIGMYFDHNEATRRLNARFGFEAAGHLPEIAEVRGQSRGLKLAILRVGKNASDPATAVPRNNEHDQPIGPALPTWAPCPLPTKAVIEGRYCRLDPLSIAAHTADLYAANALDATGASWTYLSYGPFANQADYQSWLESFCLGDDPLFFSIIDRSTNKAIGIASYVDIDPSNGCIEVGHLHYAPELQRTPLSTEAMYLMMKQAFQWGYRRYCWKCDRLNAPSRAAAQRLGLSFEGVFRHARVYNGRSRDTAWYAVIDSDWPTLQKVIESWLAPENFDTNGQQQTRLSEQTHPHLKKRG
jgi:L-amino acid N-acyltransferase YncA